ncbi:YwiC-like family protein [Evansella cellulosilytica]|uniref:YwiC-like family protein n=1 Tax=Evansella cellulosilytica (strain ATCC 21833 / DSM 2522 / FERM P-1141 / JCM 9156 / N-4) TaxID=649639 RepID=E6TXW5_EVAC2|nr:YwiC-like family protein [Evansella cellulosilytica]ADU31178.1 hypothetical protein Bcell_2927 [Evansella cellulosilytica DSM 2522]
MKWYIPREHGAWAMLIVPYWIGAITSGFQWGHLLFFLGVFSFYFAQSPLLTYIRNTKKSDVWPSFIVYMIIGGMFTVPYVIIYPHILFIGSVIIALFACNVYFAKTKRERWFINDLIAIVALSSLLPIAHIISGNVLQGHVFTYLFLTVLYFTSSVFHVKSLIREKNNRLFHKWSFAYHIAIVIITIYLQYYLIAIVFIITFLKAIAFPKQLLKKPMNIGIVEIINSLLFFIFIILHHI